MISQFDLSLYIRVNLLGKTRVSSLGKTFGNVILLKM